jgi:hypothetical protein
MQRIAPLVLALVFAFTSSACVIVSDRKRGRSSHAHSKKCHPSQYWDGHQCKHKGKGKGARKHDNRRK